eukprot:jgi/Chrzof1/998/Cz01g36090.t1
MPPAASDRGSDGGDSLEELEPQQYEWLQEQLQHIGELTIQDEDSEDNWQDPTDGILTRLFEACEDGLVGELPGLLDELRQAGHSLDIPGPDGDAPLHIASLYGNTECVLYLLDNGVKADVVNANDASTAVHDAAASGCLDIVQLLVEKAGTAIVDQADSDGDTALHNAARGGHADIVQYLLQQGADPKLVNIAGKTPAQETDDQEVRGLFEQHQQQRS